MSASGITNILTFTYNGVDYHPKDFNELRELIASIEKDASSEEKKIDEKINSLKYVYTDDEDKKLIKVINLSSMTKNANMALKNIVNNFPIVQALSWYKNRNTALFRNYVKIYLLWHGLRYGFADVSVDLDGLIDFISDMDDCIIKSHDPVPGVAEKYHFHADLITHSDWGNCFLELLNAGYIRILSEMDDAGEMQIQIYVDSNLHDVYTAMEHIACDDSVLDKIDTDHLARLMAKTFTGIEEKEECDG